MNTIEQVLKVFQGFRAEPTAIDQYEQKGKAILAEKMNQYIASGDPIEFRMLGFPFKSRNTRDKVIGTLPDLAEQLTLDHFVEFNKKVKQVYAPGVKMILVSDGLIFNDVWSIPDSDTEAYHEVVKDMSKTDCIEWYNARDFYPKRLAITEVRDKIMKQFGPTPEQLTADILTNPDVNFLYRGMIRFGTEELANMTWPSPTQLQKAAKAFARETMLRNQAYTDLMSAEFPNAIRISMHPSINDGSKYSIQLLPGTKEKVCFSAWHCAILIDKQGDIQTVHRKDAELAGYKMINMAGRPFYFIEN